MQAFKRINQSSVATFDADELELVESLLGQLVELIVDEAYGCQFSPCVSSDTEDLFTRLEREIVSGGQAFEMGPQVDPVIQRLFPEAYPDDESANHDFHRFTAQAQSQDKVDAARLMLADLALAQGHGFCEVSDEHLWAWLKSLTNLRLALSVRLDIKTAEDSEFLADLPEDSPRAWIYSVYEWLGWIQESLLAAQEPTLG